MNILIVITKAEAGGAQMSVLNLSRELKNRGNKAVVGFGEGNFLAEELAKENIPFVRFNWLKRTHNPLANIFFIFEIRNFLKKNIQELSPLPKGGQRGVGERGRGYLENSFPPLQGGNKGGRFDIVHFNSSNSLFGAIGAKLADRKIKTVFTFRGMSMLDENYKKDLWLKKIYRLFFKLFLKFVDAPVFVSQQNLSASQKSNLTQKGVLVYNGLDEKKMDFFEPKKAIKQLTEKTKINLSEKYIIGSIGRLCYAKNYEFLIDIFPDILKIKPEAVLIMIGEGDERKKYEKLIKEKKLEEKIFLLGNIDNAGRYIKGFKLFVLPSRYEGLSITLIEALFSGAPALVSDVGGNREVFLSDYELYELDNKKEFLEKFEKLQAEKILEEIKETNAKQVEKFNIKNTALGYEEIYKK